MSLLVIVYCDFLRSFYVLFFTTRPMVFHPCVPCLPLHASFPLLGLLFLGTWLFLSLSPWDLLGSSILGFSFYAVATHVGLPIVLLASLPRVFFTSSVFTFLLLTAGRTPHIYTPSVSSRRSVSYYPLPCGLFLAHISLCFVFRCFV